MGSQVVTRIILETTHSSTDIVDLSKSIISLLASQSSQLSFSLSTLATSQDTESSLDWSVVNSSTSEFGAQNAEEIVFLNTRNLTDLEIAQIWLVSNFEIERIEANERQTHPSTHFSTSLRHPSLVVISGISPPFRYHNSVLTDQPPTPISQLSPEGLLDRQTAPWL